MNCPKCNKSMIGIEYAYGHPQRYDGISKWACPDCNLNIGRWSGKILKDGEFEYRFGEDNLKSNNGKKENND